MAKRIDRSRVDSGKFELPKKLSFLTSEKVDFTALIDNDGSYDVVIPATVLAKLVKTKGELKALKAEQKQVASGHAAALEAEKTAHGNTQVALAKAERSLKKLHKRLESETPFSEGKSTAPVARRGKVAGGDGVNNGLAGPADVKLEASAPTAPKKVSRQKAVAKAAKAVVEHQGDSLPNGHASA